MSEPDREHSADPHADETQRLLIALGEIELYAQRLRTFLEMGYGAELLPVRDLPTGPEARTYLDLAREIVDTHRKAPYWQRAYEPLPDEAAKWRENFRLMFKAGRDADKRYGEIGWRRMLELVPPPNDIELARTAEKLMRDVLAREKAPRDAAVELTLVLFRNHRNQDLRRDFVRQGADLKVQRDAKQSSGFEERIDMMMGALADIMGKGRKKRGNAAKSTAPDKAQQAPAAGPK
jgi:hypothetical protein